MIQKNKNSFCTKFADHYSLVLQDCIPYIACLCMCIHMYYNFSVCYVYVCICACVCASVYVCVQFSLREFLHSFIRSVRCIWVHHLLAGPYGVVEPMRTPPISSNTTTATITIATTITTIAIKPLRTQMRIPPNTAHSFFIIFQKCIQIL